MQVDQREALDDPRPVVGVMAHAYAHPLLLNTSCNSSKINTSSRSNNADVDSVEDGTQEGEIGDESGKIVVTVAQAAEEQAEAAANELVIEALYGAESETIGPQVRFLGLPRGTKFPDKKPDGGRWRGPDGLRVVESGLPRGLVKRGWMHKHTRELPGSLVYLASVDVSASAESWSNTEDEIVADLVKVLAGLGARDVKVLLVLVKAGGGAGQTGGREERDVAEERAQNLRRRAEVDARSVVTVSESDLAAGSGSSSPASVRRIAKAAKDMAIAHYASHISRLRRWEKVLVPAQRMYRPLLTRLYFKLGVLHEMQGLVDRSVLCYQEVAALLGDMVPRDGSAFPLPSDPSGEEGDGASPGGTGLWDAVDPMEQIRGVAEVVHLRLVRNHLHRNMSVEGAIRQLRKHVASFGRLPSGVLAKGGGMGEGEGWLGGEGAGVVPYLHHAWLSRQYLSFGEMLGEHLSQFPLTRVRADAGGLGYSSPGYYYLGAALQAIRRRKTSERLLRGMDEDEVRSSLEGKGLKVRQPVHLGESASLMDPNNPQRDLRRECRAFLNLEEAKADRAEVARSLLLKALEHCPERETDKKVFRRRRVLILAHLGEESFVAKRYEDALERLPLVWKTYLGDGWLQLAAVTLKRVYVSAWRAGKARTAADTALRLAGKCLWPWVPEDDRRRFLADALPLVGALPRCSPVSAFVSSESSEQPGSTSSPAEERQDEVLSLEVDGSRLVAKVSAKFSSGEVSPGDAISVQVALLSLLPVDARLESLELVFNHPALTCVVRDNRGDWPGREAATAPLGVAHLADLALPAMGLLRLDVRVCVPWEASSALESASRSGGSLQLSQARALMRDTGDSYAAGNKGLALVIPAGTADDISKERGGEKWARAQGFEFVQLVPPRARARVSIESPPTLLVGLMTRLLVKVSAFVNGADTKPDASRELRSRTARCDDGKPAHPFLGGFLHLECEPAPVPPPVMAEIFSPSTVSNSAPPPVPPPARPRPERAFFWEPCSSSVRRGVHEAGDGGMNKGAGEGDSGGGGGGASAVEGFQPVVVGSDGQPVDGIPLPFSTPLVEEGEGGELSVSVPVWVRSETAGRVAVRARVVYGLEGRALSTELGGEKASVVEGGVAVTEWGRAEVVCVRPITAAVDVVPLQASDSNRINPLHPLERPGHAVAIKVTVTNLQDKRLVISRMEVVPPHPPTLTSTEVDDNSDAVLPWASLPNGSLLHDDAADGACHSVVLPGPGDSYTCCFNAKGDARRPAPLGRLRVLWKPEGMIREGGDVLGGGAVVLATTEFPLPVLSARPPALSARLKAPPHARVGEEFSFSWEVSNTTTSYSTMQLTAEEGTDFIWTGKRQCTLQVAPSETISIVYHLLPLVPGHVLLPKVTVVPEREQVNIIPEFSEGRSHIFVRP